MLTREEMIIIDKFFEIYFIELLFFKRENKCCWIRSFFYFVSMLHLSVPFILCLIDIILLQYVKDLSMCYMNINW